jgi:LytS/YehU family sensor histidine kinase
METSPNTILLVGIIVVLAAVVGWLVFRLRQSDQKRQAAQEQFLMLEGKVNDLQLETLESKLNPHLFKNILNSIQSHAYQTYFAMDKLANVLDYILYESRQKFVSPKEEIEFALNLIEINKIKVSPLFELSVKTKIGDNEPLYDQKLLAPLICIDLIENAFKHADLQSPDAFISVLFEFRDNTFLITVANKISDKKMLKKEQSGIGQATLEQRLKIIYKNHFKFERFVDSDTYTVHLKINLRDHKAQMLTAR